MFELSIKQEGVTVPPPSVVANPKVELWRDTTGAIYAYGETRGDECWMHVPGVASYRFTRQGDDVAASVADGAHQDVVLDAYRRRVLPMAVQFRGCEVLHASAVQSPAGVVALCGVSQTGKSTIAFGLSRRGYPVWCDDAFAWDFTAGRASSIALPFELRLRPPTASFFRSTTRPNVSTKDDPASVGCNRASVALLCVLQRSDQQTAPVEIRQLPFAQAFSDVLSHAFWFTIADAADKRRVIGNYIDLAANTPIYEVSFRSGLENLAHVLDSIEDTIQKVSA